MDATPQDQQRPSGEEPPSPWEWLVAAIGLLLLLASIGYLVHDALGRGKEPPRPLVQVLGVQAQESHFLVRVQVTNRSRATAADLRVEGVLRRGGEVVERSETAFVYVPGMSTREGGLFFSQDPRTLQLEVSVRSYQEP